MLKNIKNVKKSIAYFLVLCMLFILTFTSSAFVMCYGTVTITSPENQSTVDPGVVRISGEYEGSYHPQICINGEELYDCHADDNGDESGTWYYDLDTTPYSGEIEVFVRTQCTTTRYWCWADPYTLNVNNPDANIPTVTISNPDDASTVSGVVPVTVVVSAVNTISSVQVRVNLGTWNTATLNGGNYVYNWDTSGIGNKTCCIEAKATDVNENTGYSMTTYAYVGTGSSETTVYNAQERAIWIWETATYRLIQNSGSKDVLDAFCNDETMTSPPQPIRTLYLYADRYDGNFLLKDNPEEYRAFISWAHNNGYQVFALLASSRYLAPSMAYTRYHYKAVKLMENVINYNISSDANERFDGVNCDIEPHGQAEWYDDVPAYQLQYLNMLDKMIQRRNVAEINLSFGPAIPRWFDKNSQCRNIEWHGETKWLADHVQDISDYVSIMDYRDIASGPSGIIKGGQGEVDYATEIGKDDSLVIGVETMDYGSTGDPESCTFNEECRTWMESVLADVVDAFSSEAGYGGIAVHYYGSFRALPTIWGATGMTWSPPADTTAPSALTTVTATTFDYQRIDIKFGGATDNTDLAGYNVYRSTTSGFTPGPTNLAAKVRFWTFFKDKGLLADTTYYYKVCAVDVKGNIGPASEEVYDTTDTTTLTPMIIASMAMEWSGKYGILTMTVEDMDTSEGIDSALVHGHFTYSCGKYVDKSTDSVGFMTKNSEWPLVKEHGVIGFFVDRLLKSGYYWASAYDPDASATCEW